MAIWDIFRRKRAKEQTWEEEEFYPEEGRSDAGMKNASQSGGKQVSGRSTSGENATGASMMPEKELSQLFAEDLEQEKVVPMSKQDANRLIQDCKDAIAESDRQIERAKVEYEQVTEYLTDIQKIDQIDGEDRDKLYDLCKKIKRLLQEREQYKNREVTISERQIKRFDRFQDELIDEIKKMYQNEVYQKAIESDIKHLEAEKAFIRNTRKEAESKQNALKGITKGLAGLMISLIILFILLYFNISNDMTYPYLATLALGAAGAAVIFVEAGRNRQEMVLCDRKLTKAISLLNRTKIKYINNVSVLDYDREKYGVKNAGEFEELWGEYCKAKEFERRYRENAERLSQSNEDLQKLLAEYQVQDTEVWLVQTYAILDAREMVEIRHDLNGRRQKLREQIQYNTTVREEYMEKMATLSAMT